MTTVQKILLDVRALFDELSKNGTILGDAVVADLQTAGIRFADMAQKELFRTGNIYKKFEVTQRNPDSLLGKFAGFDIKTFEGTDYVTDAVQARSYYFEADDEGLCVIEELEGGAWQTLTTIALASADSMQVYKGLITPTTTGNQIRLRFTGTTYYKFQNIGLFSQPFKADKVPDYRPWIKYEMPADYRMTDKVIEEFPERQYQLSANYKWEGFKELWVNYYYYGTLRVVYKPIPTTITSLTDVLEVDDITANAITYYVAAKIAPHEMQELTTFFEQKYNELKLESFIKMPSSEQAIIDVYGGF